MDNCTICDQYILNTKENYWGKYFGKKYAQETDIIRETSNFICIAGIGALTTGYVLIFPKVHISSIGSLPENLFLELKKEKQMVRKSLIGLYGSAIFLNMAQVQRVILEVV